MPRVRVADPPPTSRRDRMIHIRARLFSPRHQRPVWKLVPTTVPHRAQNAIQRPRFPWVEGIFADAAIQPHIHSTNVVLFHRAKRHVYQLFCKNHCRLLLNHKLPGGWHGDIILMRLDRHEVDVVNAQALDKRRMDFVARQFVQRAIQERPFRFPNNLTFHL